MIEINLIPEELKVKIKKTSAPLDSKKILYLIPIGVSILLLAHIWLGVSNISLNYKYKGLNAQWVVLEPQMKALEENNKENNLLRDDDSVLQALINERVNWADKLNKLSLCLPSGIWFNEITVLNKVFTLKATVISIEKEEMSLINKFLLGLKNDKGFSRDFKILELGTIRREKLGSYDASSFSLAGSLK
jgi:hypothetical protein